MIRKNGAEKLLTKERHFAFNIWDYESARAVMDAAAKVDQNVILQTSVGIYKELSSRPFVEFIKSYSEYKGISVWLNIDHCKDEDTLISAIDNGWDMVMADGSAMTIENNINFTNKIAKYAHKKGVLVEAEVGQVKGIEDDLDVRQEAIASKQDINIFLDSTDIDFIAVAFGNAHGEYKVKPNLKYELVEYTTSITGKPFVVHGGSGLSDSALSKLLNINGVMKVNISTDIKTAYKRGIEKVSSKWTQPIGTSDTIHDEIMNTAISKMKLLSKGL